MDQRPCYHLAILPSPGMGHLIPLVEFAKRLVNLHDFHVSCIIPTIGSPTKSVKETLQALPATIDVVYLPPVTFNDTPFQSEASIRPETKVSLAVTRSLSPFRDVMKSLKASYSSKLVGLVVDGFGTDAFDIAKELGISSYIFFLSSAMMMLFSLELPQLDQKVSGEYRDMVEPVRLPGCVPIHGKDFQDPVQDRSDLVYKLMLHHTKRFRLADGLILNSFMELEEGAIQVLLRDEPARPPVYPIGPLIKTGSSTRPVNDGSDNYCLKWLDNQPSGSVLFVSFGSGGTLSYSQSTELALGLEMSGQRFLWVVRSPDDKSSNASFFNVQRNDDDPFAFLPDGFVERTKTRGLLVSSWAPQAYVLAHASTGGFVTHCGWNSTLESVVHGVPLIAWPLYAEQKMNAVMLTESANVALRPEFDQNGLVGREEIARIVRSLMEGEEGKRVCKCMRDLKSAAAKVLGEDGSSTKALSDLASNLIGKGA